MIFTVHAKFLHISQRCHYFFSINFATQSLLFIFGMYTYLDATSNSIKNRSFRSFILKFCLNGYLPKGKKVCILLLEILPHVLGIEQRFWFPGWGQILTPQLAGIEPGTKPGSHMDLSGLEFSLPPEECGYVQSPGGPPSIMQALCRPIADSLSTSHPQIPPSQ